MLEGGRMLRGVVVLALAAVWAGGCSRPTPLPMEREKFVEVMVALRRAALEADTDRGEFDTRKAAILKEAGVTEQQLRDYASQAPRDARALSETYDSIVAQVQRFHEPE